MAYLYCSITHYIELYNEKYNACIDDIGNKNPRLWHDKNRKDYKKFITFCHSLSPTEWQNCKYPYLIGNIEDEQDAMGRALDHCKKHGTHHVSFILLESDGGKMMPVRPNPKLLTIL